MIMIEPEYEYVDLVFENCDVVRISNGHVLYINVSNIFENMFINAIGQFVCFKSCGSFEIILKKDAINTPTHFDKELKIKNEFKNHLNIWKDITGVYIKTKSSDSEIHIQLPYKTLDDKTESPNYLMKVFNLDNDEIKILVEEE